MVAQVDEQHPAMVADAMAPAGKPHGLPDVAFAQRAAGVGTIAMHEGFWPISGVIQGLALRRAKSAWGVRFVKASAFPAPMPPCSARRIMRYSTASVLQTAGRGGRFRPIWSKVAKGSEGEP